MQHSPSAILALIAAGCLALPGMTSAVSADLIQWTAGGDGITFQDPANWDTGNVPGAGNDVLFSAAAAVTFTDDAVSQTLTLILGANVSFNLNSFIYSVLEELTITFNSTLSIENGTLSAGTALIDAGGGATATLNVLIGGNLEVAGEMIVGNVAAGVVVIEDGGSAEAGTLLVGNVMGGDGFIDVQSGASFGTISAILGNLDGSEGQIDVAGSWNNLTSIIVGNLGEGELNIGHDGTASTGTGGDVVTDSLIVGAADGGVGTVNVGEDATLETNTATIAIAENSTGSVMVGADGTWVNHGSITIGGLAGTGGEGLINVDNGGLVHSQSLTVGDGGTVTQVGTGAIVLADTGASIGDFDQAVQDLIADGGLFVASNGLSILNGGLVEATQAYIDSFDAQGAASAVVDGEDSLLDLNGGDLVVGAIGNGTLAITGGGKVESGEGVIGAAAGSNGAVTVSGQDGEENASEWAITGGLVVGDEGIGSLTVADGGLVTTTAGVDVGVNEGQGEIAVIGEGSLLDVAGDMILGFDAGIGHAVAEQDANAILNVSAGGVVELGGALTVNETGMLMGNGSILGSVTVHGILRPGNSTGTLNITGTLTLTDGSTFLVHYIAEEMEGQEGVLQASMVDVDGNAILSAGTLIHLVKVGGGAVLEGDQLIILHADDISTVDGDLTEIVVQDLSTTFVEWVLSTEPGNSEILVLTAEFKEQDLLEALEGLSPNFQNLIEAAFEVPELKAAIFSLTEDELVRGIQSLMPLQHGAAAKQRIRASQLYHNSFLAQMAAHRIGLAPAARMAAGNVPAGMIGSTAHDPAAFAQAVRSLERSENGLSLGGFQDAGTAGEWGGFIQGMGIWDRVDSGTDRTGHRARVAGGFGGIHNHLSREFLLGISAGYLNTDLNFSDNFGDGEIHTIRVGPYLSWMPGGGDLFIDGSATYGYHRNEVNRRVTVPAPETNARARYDAHDISLLGQAGYDFRIYDHTTLTPLVGVEFTHLRTDSFRESGADAALDVDSQTTDSLRVRLGARLSHAFEIADHVIVPEVYGGWAHEFLDRDVDLRSRFVAGGPSFTTRAAGVSRDAFQVAAGFTAMSGTYITLYVRYEGEFQSNRRSHGVAGGLNINF